MYEEGYVTMSPLNILMFILVLLVLIGILNAIL